MYLLIPYNQRSDIVCGRFTLTVSEQTLQTYLNNTFNVSNKTAISHQPQYNIAPSQNILTVINDGKKDRVGYISWGFIPAWQHTKKNAIINARSETIDKLKSFKQAFKLKRCIILSDGFYEWHHITKKPFHFTLSNRKIFAFAGLWNSTILEDGTTHYSCVIITTEANALLKDKHHRMPVILSPNDYSTWLNPNQNNTKTLKTILKPYKSSDMSAYPVSSAVNNPSNNFIDCIKPL